MTVDIDSLYARLRTKGIRGRPLSAATVAGRLGHASSSVTLNVYAQFLGSG
jgi:hypothetical protein